MWIGEAAHEAGVNVQTLRYYERRGLLSRPPRRASGYRHYRADAIRVVRFIKRAQELGFSLDEIEQLIELRGVTAGERHRVRAIAERKIAEIDRKRAQLRAMRRALATLVEACHHAGAPACPIIEALAGRESHGLSARSSARGGGAPRAGKE
ncbi:MAG: heavy metal-responsive transcriptional regulator [Acidobacteria bacterium]|nr:MAG: heavy metal-responsive transcriptional regulator [Acidobacteriota bacterium]